MRARALATVAVVVVVGSYAGSADAQPEDRRAAAQALFEQARSLIDAGRFKEACPKLADSMRLDPGIGTSLWLADCYENSGQLASAWAQFKEAAASAAMHKDPRENVARARADALEKRLPRLRIAVSDGARRPDVVITRDGLDVGKEQIDNPLPVDPGAHTITATAPGHLPWKTAVDVPAQPTTTTVTIPALERDPAADRKAAAAQADASTGNGQRVLGLVVAGLGVAGAGVGTYFSFTAKSTYDDSNRDGHCVDNFCDAVGKDLRSDASTQATIATIGIGVGAALVVAGAVLFFTAPRARTVSATAGSFTVRF